MPHEERELGCDLAYLFSAPLWGNLDEKNPKMAIRSLDFQKEQADLFETLQLSGKQVRLQIEVATHPNFVRLSTKGTRALHFSGHGKETLLAFEDGVGKVHPLTPQDVYAMLSAGNQAASIEIVFVSACNSELTGLAFAEAGVPHVIAVKRSESIADESARSFMKTFYLAVLAGKTVQSAFDLAVQAVRHAPNQVNKEEIRKFLLLPEGGNHAVQIFRGLPKGLFQTLGAETANNLPSPVESFLGRNFEMQALVQHMVTVDGGQLLHLTGPPKVGKSSVARETARYCLIRKMFTGGVYLADAEDFANNQSMTLAAWIAQECGFSHTPALTARQLVTYFKSGSHASGPQYLLILDNVDTLLGPKKSGRSLAPVVTALLALPVKILMTSRKPITDLTPHYPMEVKALDPLEAARLFYLSAPRRIEPIEYGATKDDATLLGRHKLLQMMAGNPGKLKYGAQKLSAGVSMEHLPEIIRAYLLNWDRTYAIRVGEQIPLPTLTINNPGLKAQALEVWTQAFDSPAGGPWDNLEPVLVERFQEIAPDRALTRADYQAVRSQFHMGMVNPENFSAFWLWWAGWELCISKSLPCWNVAGGVTVIHGPDFAQHAIGQLRDCPPGTFVLRPSNSAPGNLAVAYIESDHSYKQLLVNANGEGFKINLTDTGDRVYATLTELLLKCKKLVYVYPNSEKEAVLCKDVDEMPH